LQANAGGTEAYKLAESIKKIRTMHMKEVIKLIGQRISDAAKGWIEHAEEVVNDVSQAWPDAACSVVTKQATFALLQQTSKGVKQLVETGKFKKKEYDLIMGEIYRCRKQLVYKPPDIAAQTPETIIRRTPMIEGLVDRDCSIDPSRGSTTVNGVNDGNTTSSAHESCFKHMLDSGKEVVHNRGEFLFKEGEDADGVYIVLRGSVQFRRIGHGFRSRNSRGSAMGNFLGEGQATKTDFTASRHHIPHVLTKFGLVGHLELLLNEMQNKYCARGVSGDGNPFESWKLGDGAKWQSKNQLPRLFSAVCKSMVRAYFIPNANYLAMVNYADAQASNDGGKYQAYLETNQASNTREILWRTASIPLVYTYVSEIVGAQDMLSDEKASSMESACKYVSGCG
jgi:CRP-like cAMP-binding protein